MPSVGAATSWLNSPAPVEPLRLRRVPLLAAALCFATGDLLAYRYHSPLLLLAATTLLLTLCLIALRKSPRLAILPALALWITLGLWCSQIAPPVPQQRELQTFADGLSRTVRGHVTRIRSLGQPTPDTESDAPAPYDPSAWETDTAPATQSIDLDLNAIEVLTPDTSTVTPIAGGARIVLTGPPLALHCGDTLELPVRLRTPDTYRTPGAFSYANQLLTEGIGAHGSTKSSTVQILSASKPTLHCRLFAAQSWAASRLDTFVRSPANRRLPHIAQLTPEDASMLNAMLFGDRSHLSHHLRNAFERTGTFHLFVVSGLHVALLAAALFWLLRRCHLPEAPAVLITILLATAYTALTGFGVPAQRALLMTSIYLTARWLDREVSPLNALGAASLAVLALSPRALFESSFQMTFLVILAISGLAVPLYLRLFARHSFALHNLDVLDLDAALHPNLAQFRLRLRLFCELSALNLHPRLYSLPVWLLRAGFHLAQAILISLVAELCMVLPMAIVFHRATLLALPLNLIDIPLLAALLCAAITMFLSSLLSTWLAAIPAALTALLLHLMRLTIDLTQHAALPGFSIADIRIPAPPAPAIVLACTAIAFGCYALRSSRRAVLTTGILALLLIPALVFYPAPPLTHPHTLEVTALDVGQGDSLLVISPTGHTLLVDAGGPTGRPTSTANAWDVGEQVVAPYLWSRRIRHLDAVLLSHAHSDHMGGLPAILRDFHPHDLYLSLEPANSPQLRALLQQAATQHITIHHLRAGDRFPFADLDPTLTATILSPEPTYTNRSTPTNDDSLVLRLDYGLASVLLEGDAEARSEATMLQNHRLSPTTLLKIGHHGSRTSTTPDFLSAVAPQQAVISVGRHNTFGHPRTEVLSRLEAAHIHTYRTDRQGTETFLLTPDGRISSQSTASK